MDAKYVLEKIEPRLFVEDNEVNIKPLAVYQDEYIFFTYCIDGIMFYLRKHKIYSQERLKNILNKNRKYILDIIDRYLNIDIKCFKILSNHTVLEESDKLSFFRDNITNLICTSNLVDDYSFMPILEILENLYVRKVSYNQVEIKLLIGTFIRKQVPLYVLEQIYYNDSIMDKRIKKKLINLYSKLDKNSKVNIIDYINMCKNRSFEDVDFILSKTISLLNK